MVDYGLSYVQGDGVRLMGYTDSDWADNVIDRKRKLATLSSAEAEYMEANQASCEAI
jgi:hypothetical protein